MNQREKMLAAVVAGLVVVYGGYYWYGSHRDAMAAGRANIDAARSQLMDANDALADGRRAVKRLERWQERSLPNNVERAQTLYRAWLAEKAKDAGLTLTDIKPSARSATTAAYRTIGYQIDASGTLSQAVAMLYEFYRSPKLHQVTQFRVTRTPGAGELKITMDVEALILPGAVASDGLPEGDPRPLRLASLADYQKSLGERDLTATYTPPRPPREPVVRREAPSPPKFDDAEHAHFTATVGSGGGLQAWINVRTTGETLHVAAGDPLKVGLFDGRVVSVEPLALVVESGDKQFRVALGQALRAGKEIEADAAARTERPADDSES